MTFLAHAIVITSGMEPRLQSARSLTVAVVFECGTSNPRLLRVQNPFMKLITNAKGGVMIDETEVLRAADAG